MRAYVGNGRVRGGKLFVSHADDFGAWPDCDVRVTVEKKRKIRSLAQLAYYWPVVVPRVARKWSEGRETPCSSDEAHETLKALFMDPELIRTGRIRGQIINGLCIGTTTRDLNTLEFIEYVERIVMWAAEKWHVVIPDPDPLWREHALEEARAEENAA